MRITTSVIMFWLWFMASAALLEATGVAQSMGVSTTLGAGAGLQTAVQGASTISAGGISAQSMVGIATIVTGMAQTLTGGLTAGPRIMANVGIPPAFIAFLHAPIALLAGRMLIYTLSRRSI